MEAKVFQASRWENIHILRRELNFWKSMRAQNENRIQLSCVVFDEVSSFHPWLHASTQWKGVELRADTLPDFGTSRVSKRCHCFSLFACGLWYKHFSSWLRTRLVHCWWCHRCHQSYCKFVLRSATPRPPRDKNAVLFRFRLVNVTSAVFCRTFISTWEFESCKSCCFVRLFWVQWPQLFHSPSAGAISAECNSVFPCRHCFRTIVDDHHIIMFYKLLFAHH